MAYKHISVNTELVKNDGDVTTHHIFLLKIASSITLEAITAHLQGLCSSNFGYGAGEDFKVWCEDIKIKPYELFRIDNNH